jgi:predicted thioesterase
MADIPIGHRGKRIVRVTPEIAINFLGAEDARVLGTPYLISLLEFTARDSVKPLLEDGYDTVGTEVNIRHLAATPMGMEVTFHSEVVAIEERRVRFKVEAFDEVEKVSEGIHERFIVYVERFASRLAVKRKKTAS